MRGPERSRKERWSNYLAHTVELVAIVTLVAVGYSMSVGCAANSDGDMSIDNESGRAAPENLAEAEERLVEESDIYRIDGDLLYVQNPSTGLNILDIVNPARPVPISQVDVTGQAGELYTRDDRVFILFEEIETPCVVPEEFGIGTVRGQSEFVALENAPNDPRVAGRYCVPGTIVASRLVGDVLYVASQEWVQGGWARGAHGLSWLISFDVSDPERVFVVQVLPMSGLSREIFATNTEIYLAQQTESHPDFGSEGTHVRYIDISDPAGAMEERGEVVVGGRPAGRFHMDATDTHFRIVTASGDDWSPSSNLHIIDVSDPDVLMPVGELIGLAQGEELHATYFVGDRAYVVTFEAIIEMIDPLWIINLEDPTSPEIMSELEVPGWSDYIFPMSDRLVAVGRGDEGDRVGVALFDISNPFAPETLSRLEFGGDDATSEANIDFRGVTIVQQGVLGDSAMLVVPYTDTYVSQYGCEEPGQFLQLFDLNFNSIVQRGASEQVGTIRRSTVVGEYLYAISDEQVSAVDVSNRDRPSNVATISIGDGSQVYSCMAFGDLSEAGCSAAPSRPSSAVGWISLGILVALGLARRRA